MPLRALLDQFAPDFPGFCKVGTRHNKKIDFDAKGFIAVADSVRLLKKIKFHSIFVDEAHHPLPPRMPGSMELYRLSATHKDEPDFRYTMGQAIEDGVLCDYDITVPALTAHHAYVCLADLLLKQVGRFRRVLAYCNSVAEAKRFRMVLRKLGLAAWHINGKTPSNKRQAVIAQFAGPLQKPVHVLVTVEVLGEGINIPNADTCMFVEPRNSYRSIIQAIGRVLRHHPAKTLAHIVLPAVAIPSSGSASMLPSGVGNKEFKGDQQLSAQEANSLTVQRSELPTSRLEQRQLARNLRTLNMAHDKQAAKLKSPAPSSIATPPAAVRQADGVHPTIPSNSRVQRDNARSNSNLDFDSLERKPCRRNYGEPGRQFSPTALSDLKQNSAQLEHRQNTRASMGSSRQRQWTQTPQGFRQSNSYPTIDQEPNMQKTLATDCAKRLRTLKLKASSRPSAFHQLFGSQLERFLATLMMADHRLVAATAEHRIQVADCTLADAGASMMEGWTAEIYNRLSVLLSGEDHWETRFKELEMFANRHGRLPLRRSDSKWERTLGIWLDSQGTAFRNQRLPLHRFQKLISASAPLIRQRAEGWQSGDPDGRFRRRCQELRAYVQLHQRLPTYAGLRTASRHWKLAQWVANLRGGTIELSSNKVRMLQETHPLVKAALLEWKDAPRLIRSRWDRLFSELSMFVSARGRLPKHRGGDEVERRCYQWLRVQCGRVLAGYLPDEMAERLRNADPLIAAYMETSVRRAQSK